MATACDDPFAQRIKSSFAQYGRELALCCGDVHLTYAELDKRSARLAGALRAAGVAEGDVLALHLGRSIEIVIAELALLRIGAVYAPIDLAAPAARVSLMLEVLQPFAVICGDAEPEDMPEGVRKIRLAELEAADTQPFADWLLPQEPAVAYVMFTSGTTGVPKGVRVPRAGIERLVRPGGCVRFRPGQRWAFLSSPAFDASTLDVWGPLLNGGCCVIQPEALPSIEKLAGYLREESITDALFTTAVFNALVDQRLDAFRGMRQALTGGERASPQHCRRLLEAFPGLHLINAYGPTEVSTLTLCHAVVLADTERDAGVPVGKPIADTLIRLEGETEGEGELLAGGSPVAYGYVNNPEDTAKKFFAAEDGCRWYHTGDLVRRRPDGSYDYLGRSDNQVKIQGHRIELDEVERIIMRCAGVGEAVALVTGSEASDRYLVAWYSGVNKQVPEPAPILNELKRVLPPTAVPRVVRGIATMPINLNGKVDRKALQAMLDEAGTRAAAPLPASDDAFLSETERTLAGLWADCLRHPPVDRKADFWAIGGTSVIAMKLSGVVGHAFGVALSPLEILRHPVLQDQAERLDRMLASCEPGAGMASPEQFSLGEAQARMVEGVLRSGDPACGLQRLTLEFPPPVSGAVLQQAFETLARTHPAMRMKISQQGGRLAGVVCPELPAGWFVSHPEQDAPMPSGAALTTPDILRSGVMCADWWPHTQGGGLLVWSFHEAGLDRHSIDICLAGLHELLEERPLAPVYGSALAWPELEKSWSDGASLQHGAATLARHLGVTPLPPALAATSRHLSVRHLLSQTHAGQVAAFCREHELNPAIPVLLAWGTALRQEFGFAPLVVVSHSRRLEAELLEPVGCVVDHQALIAAPLADESLHDALLRVGQSFAAGAGAVADGLRRMEADWAVNAPGLVAHAGAFGFVWEAPLEGTRTLGKLRVRIGRTASGITGCGLSVRAGLSAAGLVLSVSGDQGLLSSGCVERLEANFGATLDALCALGAEASRHSPPELPAELGSALLQAWRAALPAAAQGQPGHFLLDGGTVEGALGMLAGLQRQRGIRIDPGRFLAAPTWHSLQRIVGRSLWQDDPMVELVGDPDAARLMVLLPGKHGGIVSLFRLATLLQAELGAGFAVVILDLDRMLQHKAGRPALEYLLDACMTRLRGLGPERVAALAGFSLGGLLALKLARRVSESKPPHVWLLNTCAPELYNRSVGRWMAWAFYNLTRGSPALVSSRVRRKLGVIRRRLLGEAPPVPAVEELGLPEWLDGLNISPEMVRVWDELHNWLARENVSNICQEVSLLVARRSANENGVIWRALTNGFNPAWFGSLQMRVIDSSHDEIPRSAVADVARIIAANRTQPGV